MDKNTKNYVEMSPDGHLVHQMPVTKNPVMETYGLWIFSPMPDNRLPKRALPQPRVFEFYGLSHLIKGDAWYWSPDRGRETYHAGQAVITTPGFVQDYKGHTQDCVEDAICFCGPIADLLFKSSVIRNGIVTIGSVRRLLPIIELAHDPSFVAQVKANMALQSLLVDVFLQNQPGEAKQYSGKIDRITDMIRQNPEKWWQVTELANMCSLSVNHFRRVFQSATGLSPKQYIDQSKINRAAEKLTVTDWNLSRIAEAFGYADQFHFSRRFKQIMGSSPRDYRMHARLSTREGD